jgi:subtilisin family serine protease
MYKFLLAFLILALKFITVTAQKDIAPNGWHLLDKEVDGYYGVSAQKAYALIKSKNLKSKTVLVAVIDTGIDTLHEALKPVLWVNPKEIPGNGIDDDKNGYVDDINGWNFIGGKDGRNVKEDSQEEARIYHGLKAKYEGREINDYELAAADKQEYSLWKKAKAKIFEEGENSEAIDILILRKIFSNLKESDSILKVAVGKNVFTGNELNSFIAKDYTTRKAKNDLLGLMRLNNKMDETNAAFMEGFSEYAGGEERKEEAKNYPPKNYRAEIVKDDENNITDRSYGNNDIMASFSSHGTHCSGIIAGINNGKGINGIADNVRIMMLRAVPEGDEHDKDIANAIRYAVDNGAKIISMSFGKDFSPEKKWVDEAFRYAESKNVLLVKAAGNDNKNIDVEESYPSATYLDGKGKAGNVITVGASGDPKTGGLTAYFSNFGKKEVDVFAPGVKIYSTLPGSNNYGNQNGTSMACPLVAGIAALTLEYFPNLTAKQLKYVIEHSALPPNYKVVKPGSDKMVNMSDVCKTGGIVNAYEALKLAASLKTEKKEITTTLPKPKLVKNKKG